MDHPAETNPILTDPEEMKCYNSHVYAFMDYHKDTLQEFPKEDKILVQLNQAFLNLISPQPLGIGSLQQPREPTTAMNKSKVRSTLKQFYREWCSQSNQIATTYKRIIQLFKKHREPSKDIHILLPGCGLGRIVFEFVKEGYSAHGNEVSYFMLFGSDFVLNNIEQAQSIEIAPFIHIHEQLQKRTDRLRKVKIPDVVVSKELAEDCGDFSMNSGDFVEVYSKQKNRFGGVVTCYFLDTANNIFTYVDTIYETLQKDGLWVNYGPLLYHYRENPKQVSLEISWEALMKYVSEKFQVLESGFENGSTYCHFPEHGQKVVYKCGWFAAVKKNKQSLLNP